MPYASNSELPDSVIKNLPSHAQDIYRSAFNSAWGDPAETREQIAHKVAWAAVKKKYTKEDDHWIEKT